MNIAEQIKEHLSKGETEKAIQLLVEFTKETNSTKRDDAILLSGQYQQWKREMSLGVAQSSNELRRIEKTILDILQEKARNKNQPPPVARTPVTTTATAPLPAAASSNNKPLIMGGVGLLVLALIMYFVFSGDDDVEPIEDNALNTTIVENGNESDENETFDNSTDAPSRDDAIDFDVVSAITFTNNGQEFDFIHMDDGRWVENDADGNIKFQFEEYHRDDWSVYLDDVNRDVNLQLDLYKSEVSLINPDESRSVLYKIVNWTEE